MNLSPQWSGIDEMSFNVFSHQYHMCFLDLVTQFRTFSKDLIACFHLCFERYFMHMPVIQFDPTPVSKQLIIFLF